MLSETLRTSSFSQKLSSPKGFQKPFGQAASLKNSPLQSVFRSPSDKQFLSKTLLSEGFPETLRTSSFSQKLSSPKCFQKPFGKAASLKNSPLRRVFRNPSDKQLLSKTLLSEGLSETLRTSRFSQQLSSPKGFLKPFGQAASLKNSPLRRVSRSPSDKQFLSKTSLSESVVRNPSDKQFLSNTPLSEGFSETLRTSSFSQKLSSPKGFRKPFGQAASLKNSPLRRVSRNRSDKQLLSKTLLSEGFPETLRTSSFSQKLPSPKTLRTSSFSQKLSSPKGFQKPFGQAASLKNSPLRRVFRNPSDKQLLSKTLLSEGFPETLRTSSFSQKLPSPKGFQKPFGQAASLRNSSLRRVSRNPSDKQLLSKTPLSEGFSEALRTSSFSQKLSSPKGFQKPFGQAVSLKNFPLRRVFRNPSDKQFLSNTPLSERFPEALRTSSFSQKLSSPKGFQKPFRQAASLKNSPVRRVSRNPSDKQLLSKALLSKGFSETLRTSSFSQKLPSPKTFQEPFGQAASLKNFPLRKVFQKPFGQAASLKNSPLRRVFRNPSDKQLLSKTLFSEGFPETLRTSSFSQKLSSLKGFQKPFGQAASLKNSPLRRVSRNPSDKQLLSKTLLSEGFPETLRRSSFSQKLSSLKGFQKPFGQAASLKNSPLQSVFRSPSDKQLLSKTLLSEGFPETLRTSSFSQKLSSPKGFQKPFGQAASLKNSPLRRVFRNPSDKQLLSKTLLSAGSPETLRTSSFSQKLSSPKGFQKPFGQAASLKNSPLRRVSRNPSDKQLLSKTLLSEGFPETLRTGSFSQKRVGYYFSLFFGSFFTIFLVLVLRGSDRRTML